MRGLTREKMISISIGVKLLSRTRERGEWWWWWWRLAINESEQTSLRRFLCCASQVKSSQVKSSQRLVSLVSLLARQGYSLPVSRVSFAKRELSIDVPSARLWRGRGERIRMCESVLPLLCNIRHCTLRTDHQKLQNSQIHASGSRLFDTAPSKDVYNNHTTMRSILFCEKYFAGRVGGLFTFHRPHLPRLLFFQSDRERGTMCPAGMTKLL